MISEQELSKFRPWIVSVAKTGSSILPWINNPRDVDYIFYVKNNTNDDRVFKLLEHKPQNECWLIDTTDNKPVMQVFEYQSHFRKLVYGSYLPTIDILRDKTSYKRTLITYALGVGYTPTFKFWYHILTGIYMLQNNSYELTDEQARNVQLCHDKEMSLELYNWIQHQLQQFKIDIENN